MIGVKPEHLEIIKKIFREFTPGASVLAFGSRVNGNFKEWSDLDLVVIPKSPLSPMAMTRLKSAFEESDLPYRVDVMDWNSVSSEFRKLIQSKHEVIISG